MDTKPLVISRFYPLCKSFMPVAVKECLDVIRSEAQLRGDTLGTAEDLAHQLSLNVPATRRFLNGAVAVGLLSRDSAGVYVSRRDVAIGASDSAEVMFWLVRSGAGALLAKDSKKATPARVLLELPQAGAMIAKALELDIVQQVEDGYNLAADLVPYLDPKSPLYGGLFVTNYEQVASRIFTGQALWRAVQTGQTQWSYGFGVAVKDSFGLVTADPQAFAVLMQGMHQANLLEGDYFADAIDLKEVRTVLDVGGASGAWAMSLLKKVPSLEQIQIYELAAAVPLYKEMFAHYFPDHTGKVAYIEGNFFAQRETPFLLGLSAKDKFDLISLGWILHDWQDEDALIILKKVRSHLREGGTLAISEVIMSDERTDAKATMLDLTMLLQTGGKERTRSEFEKLLAFSGFRITKIIDQGTRRHLILAT